MIELFAGRNSMLAKQLSSQGIAYTIRNRRIVLEQFPSTMRHKGGDRYGTLNGVLYVLHGVQQ